MHKMQLVCMIGRSSSKVAMQGYYECVCVCVCVQEESID